MNEPTSAVSRVRAGFGERAVVAAGSARWTGTCAPGVERMVLEPAGDEAGRSTGFLRFAPGARFPEHEHAAGEEILVLAGILSDERGTHRAGTYLRNGPGSRHTPATPVGCTLFIKLHQFAPGDLASHLVDTSRTRWSRGRSPQSSVMPLHAFGTERTRLIHWRGGIGGAPVRHPGGAELLVLDGDFADEHGHYRAGTWLRLPGGSWHRPRAGRRGVLVWLKTGHLVPAALDSGVRVRATAAAA